MSVAAAVRGRSSLSGRVIQMSMHSSSKLQAVRILMLSVLWSLTVASGLVIEWRNGAHGSGKPTTSALPCSPTKKLALTSKREMLLTFPREFSIWMSVEVFGPGRAASGCQ